MENKLYPLAYGCKNKDENIRAVSRSGGVFTAISDYILDNGGVVYGCALNDKFEAVHKRAITKEERNAFRGSKYVQSDVGDTFVQVKNDLNNGISVMYSGTPCQIDGLKRYLNLSKVQTDKLITVDLVCHGVPSPKVWRDYLSYVEKKNNSKIIDVEFRNKKDYGWKDHVEKLTFINGNVCNSKEYTSLFHTDYVLRRSCHECNYTSKKRVSDITLADFWGIEKLDPEFNDNKGLSLILVNSDKGNDLFNAVSSSIEYREYPAEKVNQTTLIHPHFYKARKEEFWNDYNSNSFEYIVKKYVVGNPIIYKLKEIRKRIKK